MTFYEEQLLKIRDSYFLKDYQAERVILAKQIIDRNPNGIQLNALARAVSLSKFHFIRLFTKCYGITPHQYLTEVRIAKARQLLEAGSSTMDTCLSLGFESTTSFIGLFKKLTGFTPADYQQKKQFSRA